MLRKLRIAALLYVLIFVAGGHLLTQIRARSWENPLLVTVHPVAGDDTPATRARIERLERLELEPLARFFAEEASRYGVRLETPLLFQLAEPGPVTLPRLAGRSFVDMIAFSLRLRWAALAANRRADLPTPDITLFVVFHDGGSTPSLEHSVGLEKGLVAVAHLFAEPSAVGRNRVVIAHELLHTLGATDKYDARTSLPLYPDGYAEPGAAPLHPQPKAELMAGRIPVSETYAEIPDGLHAVVVGPATAAEIGWTK